MTAVAVLFLTVDVVGKLLRLAPVVAGTTELGYPDSVVRGLGIILAVCLAVHLIPRLSIVGAVLLTGYLGGAIATHVRVGNPVFTHMLFPVYVAVLIWGGLWLRDPRLRRALDVPE
jgi:hypothetical protein